MNSKSLPLFRGELALCIAVLMNSFGVVLMLYSGAGISAISSVPFAFSEVWPVLTLGTWTYLFQGCLVLSLMLLRKKFVPSYLFSFVVGFVFGKLLDVHEAWINVLPYNIPMRVVYFVVSYCLISLGIALSNRCKLPIVPTDLFPRELADITGIPYPKIKIGFDVICLAVTAGLTLGFLHHLEGLGIGTIAAAFTMGKAIGFAGDAESFPSYSFWSKITSLPSVHFSDKPASWHNCDRKSMSEQRYCSTRLYSGSFFARNWDFIPFFFAISLAMPDNLYFSQPLLCLVCRIWLV